MGGKEEFKKRFVIKNAKGEERGLDEIVRLCQGYKDPNAPAGEGSSAESQAVVTDNEVEVSE